MIQENDDIFMALSLRKKELELTNSDISKDAELHGVKIPAPSLSHYFNRSADKLPTEKALLFLCNRYCIDVKMTVKVLPYDDFSAKLRLKTKHNG